MKEQGTLQITVRIGPRHLGVLDRVAAEQYEGNRSMALRRLLESAITQMETEDEHVESEPADQPKAG